MTNKHFVLFFGMFLFAGLAGFLAATYNSGLWTVGLVAAVSAIGSVVALVKSMYPGGLALEGAQTRPDATEIGTALVVLAAGIATGLVIGSCVHRTWPLFLSDRAPAVVPWNSTENEPGDVEERVGWLLLSVRLKEMGLSDEEIRNVYAKGDAAVKAAGENAVKSLSLPSKGLSPSTPGTSGSPVVKPGSGQS